MLIHQIPLDAAFGALRSTPEGLSQAEAASRRLEFGPNRIERLPTTPVAVRFLRQFTHFFAALLWVAALLALITDRWTPGQGMTPLAMAIVAVIVINGAFSFWQEYQAEETMAALQGLLPHQVRALRGNSTVVVPSEDVVPGDVIFLTAGDDVPADCRLVEAFGVRVNNATVTGEARPLPRGTRPCEEADVLDSRNVLLAGTSVTSGEAKALVFATGMHTAFGKIAHLTQVTVDVPSPLQNEIGTLSFEDPPRPEVPAAVGQCRDAGIKIIMVTGDHPHTAVAVARAIGLVTGPTATLLTGEDLGRMSDTQIQLALDAEEIVCARVSADQKFRIVAALQRKRLIVAVTGDGVNDAPALRAADVGIAMGISGTDVAREASDLVLLDDNFASIVAAVKEGRAVFENIRKFLTYILTSNVPELVPYLAFAFARVPLALTVMQILAVDLGTDLLPALGLGAEPPNTRVMQRRPRSREARPLTHGLLVRAYLFLGSLEAAAAMSAFFVVLSAGGWHSGQDLPPSAALYRQATTACLTAIVCMQAVNVYLCRSRRTSVVSQRFFENPLITLGVVVEIALILSIVYTAPGHAMFGTAPIGHEAWLVILPFATAMLALEEARKALVRRRERTGPTDFDWTSASENAITK